jgi:hypothetical protein
MIAIRLFRSIARWSRDVLSRNHNDLTVTRHSQAEPLLRRRGELVSTGGLADLPLQLRSLRSKILPLTLELLHHARLGLTERAPPDDARRYEDETKKCERDHRPTAASRHPIAAAAAAATTRYGALRHALSLALRERGLRSASSGDAVTGFRVTSVPSACPRHVHTGCRGGQIHDALQSRNAFFTTRSSPE